MSVTTNKNIGDASPLEWNDAILERYRRHLLLHEIGIEGQERLAAAKILVVGAGGIGCPAITYLAAAGVGKIGIIDGDKVELSNLQRQILYSDSDVGQKKVSVACKHVAQTNPYVRTEAYGVRLDFDNVEEIISQYDFVCEGSDNYATKLLVNDVCVRLNKPFTMGSLFRFAGQVFTHADKSACWRCIYGAAPANGAQGCGQAGVLGTVAGVIGTIEATEAIKFVAGAGKLLINRLLSFDALTMSFDVFEIGCDSACPACGRAPTQFGRRTYDQISCKY